MPAYYNEIDPFAAQWLRNLIAAGHIAPGEVDERSIVDVRADDLRGFEQCHFFAGIGGWSRALRLAGWPDARPVWTGSCPCQPFSAAGRKRGSEDERHLWPAFFRLIRECGPSTIFGEQVAGAAGLAWLDHVCADLEGEGYAVAAADMPAAGVGAPHRRQRLWWLADADGRHASAEGIQRGRQQRFEPQNGSARVVADAKHAERWSQRVDREDGCHWAHDRRQEAHGEPRACGEVFAVADADHDRQQEQRRGRLLDRERQAQWHDADGRSEILRVGDSESAGPQGQWSQHSAALGQEHRRLIGLSSDAWSALEWLACTDGKARPTQPGLFPLAHGIPGRVGRLRAYGNAIVPPLAAEFIAAYAELEREEVAA